VFETLKRVFNESSRFIKSQSPARITAMAAVGLGIVVAMVMMFIWAGEKTYTPLMTNLNPEDATNIIRLLRDKKIPFKVDPSGRNISVPPEGLYEFRLELASMGLPQSSVVGYELFDKQSLGTSTFVQKMNQKRALEGELMRTINTIRGVRRSRVHLVTPQKSTFVEDQKKATASVVVDLDPGVQLSEKQVFGIGNLVSRAVEGMDVSDVVIVDSNGKTLSKNTSDPLAAATANQMDFEQKFEHEMEKRVSDILSPMVGEGKVQARVTADLDFSQVSETQTLVDPDNSAILSVERRNDTMNMVRPGPYGVSGAASNLPGQPPAANGDVKNDTVKSNEVINYKPQTTTRQVVKQLGTPKRISVAVVIDGKPVRVTDKEGKVTSKVEPWSAEQIKGFEDLVASAVGIDKKRGDVLEIRNMEFARPDFDEAERVVAEKERKSYIQNMVLYGVIGVAIILFFLVVVRPFIKWITENTIDNVDSFLPQTLEELEKLQKSAVLPGMEDAVPVVADKLDPEKVEGEMIKEKITSMIEGNPQKAALIIRDWLHEPAAKKEGGKEGDTATA
jgi:flagellar M-ring protein FliF